MGVAVFRLKWEVGPGADTLATQSVAVAILTRMLVTAKYRSLIVHRSIGKISAGPWRT